MNDQATPETPRKTPSELMREVREAVAERAPMIRAAVGGERQMLEIRLQLEGIDQKHSAAWWAHLAHIGTLDKLETLIQSSDEPTPLDLISSARNLFENLIWLKLINQDINYSLVFYAKLIQNQRQNFESYIAKLKDEAELFASIDSLDKDAMMTTIGALPASPSEEEIAAANEERLRRQAELDDLVRREFSLYAEQATYNGYGFQAYLLNNKAIPEYERRLQEVISEEANLLPVLSEKLSPALLALAHDERRWKWRALAQQVHCVKQYDFLYRYTSKLLHATPLNIITDKALDTSERRLITDYIFIAVEDTFDQIERFSYPGQVRALSIYVDEQET